MNNMETIIEGKNIIGTKLSALGNSKFKAIDPSTGNFIPGEFARVTEEEIAEIMNKSSAAFEIYRKFSGIRKAKFLEAIAEEIINLGQTLIDRTVAETGLPEGRIIGERGRTVGQLEMFAKLLRKGSWVDARIDTAIPSRQPLPKPDLRRMLVPIGPVLVFGASNFPLAFSTAGGDTASALAAGCTVVVKAHSSHPGTAYLVASAISKAAQKTNMPEGVFSMIFGNGEMAIKIVEHPHTKAVGFTGSYSGGMAIFKVATNRKKPIPVYAEMSAANPVVILPQILSLKGDAIAEGLANSITQGVGQFCTNPGIIFIIKSEGSENFLDSLSKKFELISPSTMLNKGIHKAYQEGINKLSTTENVAVLSRSKQEADYSKTQARPTILKVSANTFINNPHLSAEVFGPSSLIVECSTIKEMAEALNGLEGQLTGTIHATEEEINNEQSIIEILNKKVGRLLFGGYPTGVEVCDSMVHGGPFPSTSDSRSTSVGTGAILRFVRPICYQNFPNNLLPEELKNENPNNIMRIVDGEYTTNSIN